MVDGEPVHVAVFVPLDTGRTIDVDGEERPTVVIDAADTPEVADLARVHATEGVGDIWTEAIRSGDLLLLGISMTAPVRATFAIALDVSGHRALLDDVIESGSLVVAHTDPTLAAIENPQWLAVDIDGRALAAQVDPR